MPLERWEDPAAAVTVLSTQLDSLANNTRSALGAEFDNGSNLYVQVIAELYVDYGTNPTVNTTHDLYYVPAFDGTNYADGDASIVPAAALFCCAFQVQASTSPQRLVSQPFTMPPFIGKFLLHNNGTGQTIAASGNLVRVRPANREIV